MWRCGRRQYLRKHFNELDLNGDGYVTSSELMLMFKALKVKVSPETLARLMQEADVNGNGRIEFDEFVALVLSLRTTDQTVWVQLLQRTKPGMLQRAASVSGEFFGVRRARMGRWQRALTPTPALCAAGHESRGAPHAAGNAQPVVV